MERGLIFSTNLFLSPPHSRFYTPNDLFKSLEKNRELIRIEKTIKKLYQKLQNDFRDGKTKVGNKDCKDVNEYYLTYVEEIVKKSIGETEQKKIEKSLEDVETYYRDSKIE